MTSNRKVLTFTLLATLSLMGCTSTYVNPPLHPACPTCAGTAVGGTTGAIAAIGASSTIPAAPIFGGAVAGAMVVSSAYTTRHQLELLAARGVQVVQVGDRLRIIIPADRLFAFDDDDLKPTASLVLNPIAAFLTHFGNVPMTIAGYTDNVIYDGDRNLQFTRHRAQAVGAYLWSKGVKYYHIRAIGYGALYPIASNTTNRGSAFNRRVEIILPVVTYHYPYF